MSLIKEAAAARDYSLPPTPTSATSRGDRAVKTAITTEDLGQILDSISEKEDRGESPPRVEPSPTHYDAGSPMESGYGEWR